MNNKKLESSIKVANSIENIIGNYMLSSSEIMLALGMSQPTFCRFAKKTNLRVSRSIGTRRFYHVDDFEIAIKENTNCFQAIKIIELKKSFK